MNDCRTKSGDDSRGLGLVLYLSQRGPRHVRHIHDQFHRNLKRRLGSGTSRQWKRLQKSFRIFVQMTNERCHIWVALADGITVIG